MVMWTAGVGHKVNNHRGGVTKLQVAHDTIKELASREASLREIQEEFAEAWISCSGGRTTACDPHAVGGGEQRGPDFQHRTTTTLLLAMREPLWLRCKWCAVALQGLINASDCTGSLSRNWLTVSLEHGHLISQEVTTTVAFLPVGR